MTKSIPLGALAHPPSGRGGRSAAGRGIEAVTIDAVTKASKVARTTLYRHFGCSSDLLAATLERLLPPVTPPPSTGSLRDRLVELVCRQATLYEDAPLHPTTLAWIALRSTDNGADDAHDWQRSKGTLQARVVEHYRQPFEAILQSPEPTLNSASSTSSLPCANSWGRCCSHG